MRIIKKVLICFVLISFVISCGSAHRLNKELSEENKKSSFFKGFVLYNPETKKELINFNGNNYFTPASNTKLFTFYTAYRALKDSVKSLEYFKTADSLIIKGMADPTMLVGKEKSAVVEFLSNQSTPIYLVDVQIDERPLGTGWAWDDYQDYYQPEKSMFPIYGNLLTYKISSDTIISNPHYFNNSISILDSGKITREIHQNKFYAERKENDLYEVPFKTSVKLTADLLGEAIDKKIKIIPNKDYGFKTFYNGLYDSVYKKMLTVSDNFIAEQLLLQVGKEVVGKYSGQAAVDYSLENYLPNLPQKPRWVDGSGLSRYNLFSPNNMVYLLNKMYEEIPIEKLIDYFPVGGETGTLKSWYGNKNGKGYVFAKSGSLSNNYNLSGYLITKKGTVLIFSSMNNHFAGSNVKIKKDLEQMLESIYQSF